MTAPPNCDLQNKLLRLFRDQTPCRSRNGFGETPLRLRSAQASPTRETRVLPYGFGGAPGFAASPGLGGAPAPGAPPGISSSGALSISGAVNDSG